MSEVLGHGVFAEVEIEEDPRERGGGDQTDRRAVDAGGQSAVTSRREDNPIKGIGSKRV